MDVGKENMILLLKENIKKNMHIAMTFSPVGN